MLQVNKLTRIVLVNEIRYIMNAWYIVNSDLSETILCWGYMEAVNGSYVRMVFIFYFFESANYDVAHVLQTKS